MIRPWCTATLPWPMRDETVALSVARICRAHKLAERAQLRPHHRVDPPVGVHEHGHVHALCATERRRHLRRALADHHEVHAGRVEVVAQLVKLDRLVAAEDAAVVADEGQQAGRSRQRSPSRTGRPSWSSSTTSSSSCASLGGLVD